MEEKKKLAFNILWETREGLLKYLVEEVIEKEGVLSGKTNYEGALGFDYQELDNKYMGRLASINTFLHNLGTPPGAAPRKTPPRNRVELITAAPEDLETGINEALRKHATLKLVGTSMREAGEGKLLVLLAFTSP